MESGMNFWAFRLADPRLPFLGVRRLAVEGRLSFFTVGMGISAAWLSV